MGDTCSTIKESEYTQKYYFEQNELTNDDSPPIGGGDNREMDKNVSLLLEIKKFA